MHLSYSGGRGEGEEQLSGILLCAKTAAPCLPLEDHVMLMSMRKQKDPHARHNAALCHQSSKGKAAHCAGAGFLDNVSKSSTKEAQVSEYRRAGRLSCTPFCGCATVCSHQAGVNQLQTETWEQYCSQQDAQLPVQHTHMSMQACRLSQVSELLEEKKKRGAAQGPTIFHSFYALCHADSIPIALCRQ